MDRALSLSARPARPTLARLREELRLLPAGINRDGSPAWLIQDPVANRFFRIGWMDFEILLRWEKATPSAIAQAVGDETTLQVEEHDVESLDAFLKQHGLLQPRGTADVDAMCRRAAAQKRSAGEWLLHHYLFFRLPLVRPQDKLAALLKHTQWLFTPSALAALCLASAAGIGMVLQQWDTFANSFVDHLTWRGMTGFAVAVTFAKILHELGHALTATRFGVRVAHMGVALVVMFPMLYTDTSESWKLSNPRQRLAIAAAGILTELALAGIATLLWSFAPDGPFRTAMFFLASTSWLLTLAINASPFMRFDGYFILCDVLNFPNLHERAGAFARAWLRRTLLGLPEPWPESQLIPQRRWLVGFALVTWCYRLSVFLGIAILVYLHFFKALGIVLMTVEVIWFIARPVFSELKRWWERRAEVAVSRKRIALAGAAALLLALVVPWRSGVHGPGVVHAARQQLVFSPQAGEIAALPKHAQVAQGELMFALVQPDLRSSVQRAQALAEARALEIVGLSGQQDGEAHRASLESERQRYLAEVSVYTGAQSRLQLVAPFAGRLMDVDSQLRLGAWVQSRQPLAMLVDPSQWVAEVYVREEDIGRIVLGDEARVYAGSHAMSGRVMEVDTARAASLPYPMLDAEFGGPIVTVPKADERSSEHVVRDGIFRVRVALDEAPSRDQMMLCSAIISGARSSLLGGALEYAASVLMRESGF
jgi:putative peptide zinc metalloprotease protein